MTHLRKSYLGAKLPEKKTHLENHERNTRVEPESTIASVRKGNSCVWLSSSNNGNLTKTKGAGRKVSGAVGTFP